MLKIDNSLVDSYKKLVFGIVKNYSNEYNKDDLYQAGMLGLLEASKKYDIYSGVKFTTFAYKYILGEILKYLREDRNMKIGRDLISDYKKIMYTKDYIYKTYGRTYSNTELSKITGISEDRINEAILYNEKEVSLNKKIDEEDNNIELKDIIKVEENINKDDLILLKDALSTLNEKEKSIIYQRYYENKSQTEIANQENITQVKVYRYERKILDKLKDKMS